MIAENCVS